MRLSSLALPLIIFFLRKCDCQAMVNSLAITRIANSIRNLRLSSLNLYETVTMNGLSCSRSALPIPSPKDRRLKSLKRRTNFDNQSRKVLEWAKKSIDCPPSCTVYSVRCVCIQLWKEKIGPKVCSSRIWHASQLQSTLWHFFNAFPWLWRQLRMHEGAPYETFKLWKPSWAFDEL